MKKLSLLALLVALMGVHFGCAPKAEDGGAAPAATGEGATDEPAADTGEEAEAAPAE